VGTAAKEEKIAMPPSKPQTRTTWLHRAAGILAYLYLQFTGKTTRIKREGNSSADFDKTGKNYIFALWHSRQAFLVYAYRGRGICALVSMSHDGEYMAQLIKYLGHAAVRGSSSRGGANALLNFMSKIEEGFHPGITPDGPRGPRRKVQKGILFLAQKTGLPIIPVGCAVSRKITFNSWDRFELPLPFSRAAIVEGNPIYVGPDGKAETSATAVQRELDRVTDRADSLVL